MFAHLASLCNFKRFSFLVAFDPLEDDNNNNSNNSSNNNNGSNSSNNNGSNSSKKMSKNAWLEFFNKPGAKIEVSLAMSWTATKLRLVPKTCYPFEMH